MQTHLETADKFKFKGLLHQFLDWPVGVFSQPLLSEILKGAVWEPPLKQASCFLSASASPSIRNIIIRAKQAQVTSAGWLEELFISLHRVSVSGAPHYYSQWSHCSACWNNLGTLSKPSVCHPLNFRINTMLLMAGRKWIYRHYKR